MADVFTLRKWKGNMMLFVSGVEKTRSTNKLEKLFDV